MTKPGPLWQQTGWRIRKGDVIEYTLLLPGRARARINQRGKKWSIEVGEYRTRHRYETAAKAARSAEALLMGALKDALTTLARSRTRS